MRDLPASATDKVVEVLDDDSTPFDFVVDILRSVFGIEDTKARALTQTIDSKGAARFGPFAADVADTMIATIRARAAAAGHPFVARVADATDASGNEISCNFCGREQAQCQFIYSGRGCYICDACVINCARALGTATPTKAMRNIPDLLDWHFGGLSEADIVSVQRVFPLRMRADLQRALDTAQALEGARRIGVHGGTSYEQLTFTTLFGERRYPKTIGPLQYEELDIGEDMPMRCLINALWLLRDGDTPIAVLLSRQPQHEQPGAAITVAAPAGELSQRFADALFERLEHAVAAATSYRGKVLSLNMQEHYRGMASGITVHRLPAIAREDVILPEAAVQLIDRNIVQFARLRSRLLELGQSGKKGLLFHGPPGTGKTHTVRYLAGCLPDHTTLLITAAEAGGISEYFALARLLQPAILVIEDADLIARNRDDMGVCEEVLLNALLNEMDGLKPEAELFVILTTNRPQALEAAIAQRPGRVDQAIEFPLPDLANRLKLIHLYRGRLRIDAPLAESLARRTEGVSAAFIKELMRRIAQVVLERERGDLVDATDVDTALGELVIGRSGMMQSLLGTHLSD